MKKAVSIFLVCVLLILTLTATVNARIINQEPQQFVSEAIAQAEAESGEAISTNRVYFKMPDIDNWHCDYSVYEGKYYASIYWWDSKYINPEYYPGYRTSIDDYEQGVYYADIPDDIAYVILNNGYYPRKEQVSSDPMFVDSYDLYVEGAWEGDFDTLPEGAPKEEGMDGCIFVYNPDTVTETIYTQHPLYRFDPYIYYGNGCYGSYATTSDNFVSVEENCLNPDHFDESGNHIGGVHLKAPVAPEKPLVDHSLDGYYFVTSREPNTVRSENKLYPSFIDGEYSRYRFIDKETRFKIVHYIDGEKVSDCEQYPAEGWYNENGSINNFPSGDEYTVYFRPDGKGDSSFSDGYMKAVKNDDIAPTEVPWEQSTEPPKSELYKARFEEKYVDQNTEWFSYTEKYYHKDKNGETDWALVYAYLPMTSPIELTTIVGNRVLSPGTQYDPFKACYGIYDVKEDKFIDAGSASAKSYDGFFKVFDEIGGGRLIGDIDRDNDLSVIDATLLQRCDLKLRDYPEDDVFSVTYEWGKSRYYSDFNRDGGRDILDVTSLQRYLISE